MMLTSADLSRLGFARRRARDNAAKQALRTLQLRLKDLVHNAENVNLINSKIPCIKADSVAIADKNSLVEADSVTPAVSDSPTVDRGNTKLQAILAEPAANAAPTAAVEMAVTSFTEQADTKRRKTGTAAVAVATLAASAMSAASSANPSVNRVGSSNSTVPAAPSAAVSQRKRRRSAAAKMLAIRSRQARKFWRLLGLKMYEGRGTGRRQLERGATKLKKAVVVVAPSVNLTDNADNVSHSVDEISLSEAGSDTLAENSPIEAMEADEGASQTTHTDSGQCVGCQGCALCSSKILGHIYQSMLAKFTASEEKLQKGRDPELVMLQFLRNKVTQPCVIEEKAELLLRYGEEKYKMRRTQRETSSVTQSPSTGDREAHGSSPQLRHDCNMLLYNVPAKLKQYIVMRRTAG